MSRLQLLPAVIVALLLGVVACAPTAPGAGRAVATSQPATAGSGERLILATTTSTDDSGLLNAILPDFERRYNADVQVIAVGTGEALTLAENGDADVVLVHAREREDAFVQAGHGVDRQDVMYNDFVIIGPENDPVGIGSLSDAVEAFKRIAAAEALFLSRGDESGTHTKELSLWEAAGIEPSGSWYRSVGQGMGAVLTMAQEQQAYTLTDRATYLARKAEQGYDLPILVQGDERLFNPYGVILVNPAEHPNVNAELGRTFVEWLTSLETQEMIGEFGRETLGEPLFVPDSRAWREVHR